MNFHRLLTQTQAENSCAASGYSRFTQGVKSSATHRLRVKKYPYKSMKSNDAFPSYNL